MFFYESYFSSYLQFPSPPATFLAITPSTRTWQIYYILSSSTCVFTLTHSRLFVPLQSKDSDILDLRLNAVVPSLCLRQVSTEVIDRKGIYAYNSCFVLLPKTHLAQCVAGYGTIGKFGCQPVFGRHRHGFVHSSS